MRLLVNGVQTLPAPRKAARNVSPLHPGTFDVTFTAAVGWNEPKVFSQAAPATVDLTPTGRAGIRFRGRPA